jgi:outer membrane protein OmpA-like peptidoglycan-associated protein
VTARVAGASMALLFLAGVPAASAPRLSYPQLTLDGFGGVLSGDSSSRPDPGTAGMGGGRGGLLVRSWLGLEGTYGAASGDALRLNHVGADLVVRLLPERRICPYVTGGWAQLEIDPDHAETQTLNGWEAGGGILAPVWRRLGLRLDVRDVMVEQDAPSKWLHDVIATAGLQLAVGGSERDSDADGVGDSQDRCPDTPFDAIVDASGCPLDADKDGVADGLDNCANTPPGVRVDARGCPQDSDGDGVSDAVDACADTPRGATVDARGCPLDADADGVADGLDTCASTPRGAVVDPKGCPLDSDGDGVPDGIDQCAGTPVGSQVDSTGCTPVASAKLIELLDTGKIRLENVHFATSKVALTPDSYPALDALGQLLLQWPQLQIEIAGHTDSQGAAASNQKLSLARAQAVVDYLVQKFPGLDSKQYTAKGYGESQPVADNKTAAGRAQNRRVELRVLNRDVLRQEVERRGLVPKKND